MKDNKIIILGDSSAYLPGVKAAVMIAKSSRNFMADPEILPQPVTIKSKKYLGIVPWGENNTLPMDTISKIYINPVVSPIHEYTLENWEDLVEYMNQIDDEVNSKSVSQDNS